MKILTFLLLFVSARAAETPVEWSKLRKITHATGRAASRPNRDPDPHRSARPGGRRLEANQGTAAELEGIRRLGQLLQNDGLLTRPLQRLTAIPSALELREAADAIRRAAAEAYGPAPSSTVTVERTPLVHRPLAAPTQAARREEHQAGELDADKIVLLSRKSGLRLPNLAMIRPESMRSFGTTSNSNGIGERCRTRSPCFGRGAPERSIRRRS